jgi:regulator of sigma E protease
VVGQVMQGSPAQKAGIETGDWIAYIDDEYQHDFTKLQANIVLAGEGNELKTVIRKPDGTYRTLMIAPQRPPYDAKGFLSIGVTPAYDLVAVEDNELNRKRLAEIRANPHRVATSQVVLEPGDEIVAVNGKRLEPTRQQDRLSHDPAVREAYFDAKRRNLAAFETELQASNGRPVQITVATAGGTEDTRSVKPGFAIGVDGRSIRMGGMTMRSIIDQVTEGSPVENKALPGDVVEEVSLATPTAPAVSTPTIELLKETLNAAGNNGDKVNLKLQRGDEYVQLDGIETIKLETKKRGLGVALDLETERAVVGSVVSGSAADRAGIQRGARLTKINDTAVTTWFDVRAALATAKPNEPLTVAVAGSDKTYSLSLSEAEIEEVNAIQLTSGLELQNFSFPRQTDNVIKAMGWGVVETTSLLKQFYISLQRMIDGSVSAKNMMGPVGIFHAGTSFADRGYVWLIWFLCMISANLAVVNFLPIPIVDGGLFTFLIIEKIQGRPISAKTQTVAQIVGLALLGFVFVFATWQDISRMIWGWG